MFEKIIEFITDKNHSLPKRFSIMLLIALGVGITDYCFRFSDSYIAEKKIDQLEKIHKLLQEDSLSKSTKGELVRIESEVINRHGLWDSLSELTSFIQRTISSPNPKNIIAKPASPSKNIVIDVKEENEPKRNFWLHVISSCWVFICLDILVIAILLLTPEIRKGIKGSILIGVLYFEFIIVVIIIVYSLLTSLIPILPYYIHYGINFISVPILFFIFRIGTTQLLAFIKNTSGFGRKIKL